MHENKASKLKILIVDDAIDIRTYLFELMHNWGYHVLSASNGKEALQLVRENKIQIIIIDWMMPEMNGLEVCEKIRKTDLGYYAYIIMLTSRCVDNDLVTCLSAGSDDFIEKPVNLNELRARILSAERVVKMEYEHKKRYYNLHDEHKKIKDTYQKVQGELDEAAKIQQELLPDRNTKNGPFKFDWLFAPASDIGGDFFNYYIHDDKLCFYHIDIAGHGISAAMYGIYLNRLLLPNLGAKNSLINQLGNEFYTNPAAVVNALNKELCSPGSEYGGYLTMVYGVIRCDTGQAELCRAGHPFPIISHTNAQITTLESGNLPVGLFVDASYTSQEFKLQQGERLILYSDGVTDCMNKEQDQFSTERFISLLRSESPQQNESLMDNIQIAVDEWRGEQGISDDISIMSITYS